MWRYRKYGLVLGVIFVMVAGAIWFLQRTKTLTVPIGEKIVLDNTLYGDIAFNSDQLTAEFRATLAPGHYAVASPQGRYTLVVPAGAAVAGNLDVRVTDRGEKAGRRWVLVRAEKTRMVITPPVRVGRAHYEVVTG